MQRNNNNLVLGVLFVGVLMAALDIAIIGPALPAIRDYFRVDDRAISWVFTSYLLFNLIGTPLMARLADDWGRRLIYLGDVTLFIIGSLVVAVAPSFVWVLVGRGIQGLGSGGIFPVASAVIGDSFPPERRGRALGLIGAVFGIAFLIGPILGGVLLLFGWRWLFLAPLPIALGVLIAAARILPTSHHPSRRPFHWSGMLLLGTSLAALAFGINQWDAKNGLGGVLAPKVGMTLLLAVALGWSFWRSIRKVEYPLLSPELFRTGLARRTELLAVGAGVVEGVMVFVPALLVAAFHISHSTASFMLVPPVISLAVGAPIAGRLLDRFGARRVILAGTSLLTVGTAVISWPPLSHFTFYSGALLLGLGLAALLGAPLRYLMLQVTSATDRAAGQGLISLLTKIGQLISGNAVGGLAASLGGGVIGYVGAFRILTWFILGMVVLAWGLPRRVREQIG